MEPKRVPRVRKNDLVFQVWIPSVIFQVLYSKFYILGFVFQGFIFQCLYSRLDIPSFIFQVLYSKLDIQRVIFQVYIPFLFFFLELYFKFYILGFIFQGLYSRCYIPGYSKFHILGFILQGLYSRFIFQVSYSRFSIPSFIFQVQKGVFFRTTCLCAVKSVVLGTVAGRPKASG